MTSPKELRKPEGLGSPLLDTGAQPTAGLMEAEHAALVTQFIILLLLCCACSGRLLVPCSLQQMPDNTTCIAMCTVQHTITVRPST